MRLQSDRLTYCLSFLISWLYDRTKNEVNWMKSIKLNALSYMGIRVLNIIFPILTGTYVARILDRTDYGYFNSVNIILSFFLPFVTYGVYNYGLRTISNVKDNKKDLNRMYWPPKVRQLIYPKDLVLYCTGLSPFSFTLIRLLL